MHAPPRFSLNGAPLLELVDELDDDELCPLSVALASSLLSFEAFAAALSAPNAPSGLCKAMLAAMPTALVRAAGLAASCGNGKAVASTFSADVSFWSACFFFVAASVSEDAFPDAFALSSVHSFIGLPSSFSFSAVFCVSFEDFALGIVGRNLRNIFRFVRTFAGLSAASIIFDSVSVEPGVPVPVDTVPGVSADCVDEAAPICSGNMVFGAGAGTDSFGADAAAMFPLELLDACEFRVV